VYINWNCINIVKSSIYSRDCNHDMGCDDGNEMSMMSIEETV
jgi:hypothetical protein